MYNYNYNFYRYPYYSVSSGTVLFIVIAALLLALLLFIAWCRMFRKAGLPWERMFVPIYGSYWMYQIAECGGLFWLTICLSVLFSFILPSIEGDAMRIVSIIYLLIVLVIYIVYCRRLASAFGKGIGFTLGLIILHPLFIMILGYGSAEYQLYSSRSGRSALPSTWTCSCGTINPSHKGTCENCGAQKR